MSRPHRASTNRNPRGTRKGPIASRAGSPFNRFVELATDLGLTPEWTLVDYGEANIDADAAAQVELEDNYHVARFSVSRFNWDSDNPESQILILAHEVAHLLLADLVTAAEAVAKTMSDPAQSLALQTISRQEELLADRLARLILERTYGRDADE